MSKNPSNPSPPTPTTPLPNPSRAPIFLLALLLLTLCIQAALRLWVSAQILLQPALENQFGALVHWRGFDQFTPWITLLLLALSQTPSTKPLPHTLLKILLAAGIAALTLSLLWTETTGKASLDIAVASLLALAAALLAWQQLRELSRALTPDINPQLPNSTPGLNVEQLWRALAIQWILLWIAAELYLRIHFRKEGVEAQPTARDFLFLLPVIAVTLNLLFALGIKWWTALQPPSSPPRIRAWLVSLLLANLAAAAIAAGFHWGKPLTLTGEILLLLALPLYLLGFPSGAWSSKNAPPSSHPPHAQKLVPLSFALLFLALALMTCENFFPNEVPSLYSYAWRHLLVSSQLLWIVGFAALALQRLAPPRLLAGTRGPALAASLLLILGILAVPATLLLAIQNRDTLRGLFVGASLEAAALTLLALLFLRTTLTLQKNN